MTDSIIATQRTRDRTFFRFCAWFSSRPRRHLPGSTRPRSERFASRPAPLGKTGRTTACFHHNSTFSDGLQALSLRFPLVFVPFRLLSDYFRSFNLPAGAGTFPSRPRRHLPSGRRSRTTGAGGGRANFAKCLFCDGWRSQLCKTLHFANVSAGESGIPGETARVPAGGHPADTGGATGEGARPPAPRPPASDALPGGEAERAMNGLCNGEPAAGAGGATPRASGPPAPHHKI